jgi:hypothetical protein
MRFGSVGSMVQLENGSEGDALWRAGMLEKRGKDWRLEIEPTPLLRSLFAPMPELEELYPVLVEFVMIYRFPNAAGFVDEQEVGRKLGELGLTAGGLVTLRERIGRVVTRRP